MGASVIRTDIRDLTLLHRGKVRDMYEIPGHDDKLVVFQRMTLSWMILYQTRGRF